MKKVPQMSNLLAYDLESESSASGTDKSFPVDKASLTGCEESSSDEESTDYDLESESSVSGTDKSIPIDKAS